MDWCAQRDANPLEAAAPLIADFLLYLHSIKRLKYRTIEGYRTAISQTLKATTGTTISECPHIANLLANFARDTEAQAKPIPNWDLALVLDHLSKAPFEPIHRASLKNLTLKTVFLLTLASAKRSSEIHALREQVLHTQDWSSITLIPKTDFIAKTQLATRPDANQPIRIPALTRLVGSGDVVERSLCPVRAVRSYIDRTKELRGHRDRLFIAYKSGYDKDICKNTISGWLRKIILSAHKDVPQETMSLLKIRPHDIRGLATSWAFQKNVALQHIMDAACWRSHNTFMSYYLKDMALEVDGLHHLGPVVAAQQVL